MEKTGGANGVVSCIRCCLEEKKLLLLNNTWSPTTLHHSSSSPMFISTCNPRQNRTSTRILQELTLARRTMIARAVDCRCPLASFTVVVSCFLLAKAGLRAHKVSRMVPCLPSFLRACLCKKRAMVLWMMKKRFWILDDDDDDEREFIRAPSSDARKDEKFGFSVGYESES